jgi:hypothetical protein
MNGDRIVVKYLPMLYISISRKRMIIIGFDCAITSLAVSVAIAHEHVFDPVKFFLFDLARDKKHVQLDLLSMVSLAQTLKMTLSIVDEFIDKLQRSNITVLIEFQMAINRKAVFIFDQILYHYVSHLPRNSSVHTQCGPSCVSTPHVQHSDEHSNVQHSDEHSNVQHSEAQHSEAQHIDVQHSNLQHSEAQHSNVQHSEAQETNSCRWTQPYTQWAQKNDIRLSRDVKVIGPSLKNSIHFADSLCYRQVAQMYRSNYKTHKSHSKKNLLYWLAQFNKEYLLAEIPKKNISDVADAFMMSVAFYCKEIGINCKTLTPRVKAC